MGLQMLNCKSRNGQQCGYTQQWRQDRAKIQTEKCSGGRERPTDSDLDPIRPPDPVRSGMLLAGDVPGTGFEAKGYA